jgi:hypothetical protein
MYNTARPQDLFLDTLPQVAPQIIFPVSYSMGMGQNFTGMQHPMAYRQRGFIKSGTSTLSRVDRGQRVEGHMRKSDQPMDQERQRWRLN